MSICGKIKGEIIIDELISKSTLSSVEILIDIFFGSPVFCIVQMLPFTSNSTKTKLILINSFSINELSIFI